MSDRVWLQLDFGATVVRVDPTQEHLVKLAFNFKDPVFETVQLDGQPIHLDMSKCIGWSTSTPEYRSFHHRISEEAVLAMEAIREEVRGRPDWLE